MEAGLKIANNSGVHLWDSWLLGYGAAGAMNHGDNITAVRLLDKMSTYLTEMKSWEKSGYHFLKAREALLQGNLDEAATQAKISLKLAKKVGVFQKWNWILLLKAQIMQVLKKYKEADEDLAQVFTIANRVKSKLFKFAAHMLAAQFAYERGNSADGFKSLQKALAIGKDQKFLNIFADQPAETAKLCAKALEAGIEVEYVQEIIRRRQLILEEPPVHLENWPWTLKIYTLGRFGLVKDGKPVRFARKAQEKPLALLKALIALGGRDVHEEHIADALWPEAEGDLAHKSFATTLWRLRKLIGHANAIQLSDRKLTLDSRFCWVDVWAFERIIRQAEKTWKNGMKENTMADAISVVQNALDIYQGPFLAAEANASWAISLRERLQSRFLRTVRRLCEYWQQTGEHEKAVECFQRSIEVDDLAEDFYQDLMTCYWQMGRRADALSVYERYKETLSTKLGIEPSPEAETLREALFTSLKPIN
jgi:DNA-binding SARP family transcriptional activator